MGIFAIIKNVIKRLNGEVLTSTLVKRGMKVGVNFNRQQGSYIDPTHCFLIEIGDNVTLSIRVTILAHDASTKKILDYTRIGKVIIKDNVFIGANATILPGVTIGENSIIGANSVVTKSIPKDSVVAGNPAGVICSLEGFKKKNKDNIEKSKKCFDEDYRFSKKMLEEKKEEMRKAVEDGIAYIK